MTLVSLLIAAGSTNHSLIRLMGKIKQHMYRVGLSTNSAKFFSGQNLTTALHPMNRRLGGTHSQSELFWGQKNLPPVPRVNRFLNCPSHSLFAVPHILS